MSRRVSDSIQDHVFYFEISEIPVKYKIDYMRNVRNVGEYLPDYTA
jgi:hypothetical protein